MEASLIANCVFNAFLPFTAITLNIVTILALRKPLTIPRALKVLLLSMAVSDLGVGLLVQPLYSTSLVMLIKENTQTRTFEITLNFLNATATFLAFASLFGIVALAADRFLAVHLHLRYQELVTHKRVVAVVISIWIISFLDHKILCWHAGEPQFISQPSDLLLEDETCSTCCHGNTEKHTATSTPVTKEKSEETRQNSVCNIFKDLNQCFHLHLS